MSEIKLRKNYWVVHTDHYGKNEEWESTKDLADLLLDFNGWADNENLLVLSDNNGMGYSIKEYEKGD